MNNRSIINIIESSVKDYPNVIYKEQNCIYTCINPFSYHIVRRNMDLYNSMDGIFVDGMTMCWWIKLLWGKHIPRLSFDMSGMAAYLFAKLNSSTDSIYFIGAKQEQIELTIQQFKAAYPLMNIAGYRNGYFGSPEHRQKEINNIVDLNPCYVVVGMGSPLQEQFIMDLKDAGYKGIAFTCGGFLHQTSNGINYYPKWVNKYNLRAIYRLYKEKGLYKRLYNVLIEFPILFTYDSICSRLDCVFSNAQNKE